MELPQLQKKLSPKYIQFLEVFSRSCRRSLLEMVVNADSGHPGGSMSCIDYLSLLYTAILKESGDPIIVSNGHISPAVYSVLGEMGYVDKNEAISTFRKAGSKFEGHVTRHVKGIFYGTGPLGTGISAASGFAAGQKLSGANGKVFGILGDGEAQEGQVYEMMHFASKHKLSNFIVFVDYNKVQLSDKLETIMPIDVAGHFKAAGWDVIEVDGHDFQSMWKGISKAYKTVDRPVLLLGHTIMGKGASLMESDGRQYKSVWHGKAPSKDMAASMYPELELSIDEQKMLDEFRKNVDTSVFKSSSELHVNPGKRIVYSADTKTDCRSAYGKALESLGEANSNVVVFDSDLKGSVKTEGFESKFPQRFFQCGIAEQQMVSAGGGISFMGYVPFVSTFGVFMTSRAKDQARVNDINRANVKMVSTHCGLSVGEDGPTHQAIDDMGSFRGFFHTSVFEPADPNHTDVIIRYVASHYGNFYVRMGRHKVSVLTKEDGSPFYDENYVFEKGKYDLFRSGTDVTVIASGPMVERMLTLKNKLEGQISLEIIVANGPAIDEELLLKSLKKTGRVLTIEDHNPYSGIGSEVAKCLVFHGISVPMKVCGVSEYQLSGQPEELYSLAGLSLDDIKESLVTLIRTK